MQGIWDESDDDCLQTVTIVTNHEVINMSHQARYGPVEISLVRLVNKSG